MADARLIVCVDFKSPFAQLALAPTLALLDGLGVDADWQPFLARPLSRPTMPAAGDDVGTRHRRSRALYIERDLARYAAARGVPIGDPYRAPDSTPALLGLSYLKRARPERVRDYLVSTFAGFGQGTLALGDAGAIGAELARLGADAAGFAAFQPEGAALLAETRAKLVAAGVNDVPTYLLDGEPFQGRAHLPMLRWRLTGQAGPPPI